MSFSSFDSIISGITTSEKIFRCDFSYKANTSYTTTDTSSVGVDLSAFSRTGHGSRNTFPGTSLSYVSCNESAGNGTEIFGIPHGGNVSSDTKHILSASCILSNLVGINSNFSTLILVDLQGYWANIDYNTTSTQNLTGTPGSTLRYANGAGCRLYLVNTVASGATSPTATINYTGNKGTSESLAATRTVSSFPGVIDSANPHSPSRSTFLPLANNNIGVANCSSISFNGAVTGRGALCLARPLITMNFSRGDATANTVNCRFTEKNFLFHSPSLPRVRDGACLTWLFFPMGTSSGSGGNVPVSGHLEFIWG